MLVHFRLKLGPVESSVSVDRIFWMANIFDVAKKAGVSTYTVSRALNGHSDVSEKTRSRIIRIAEELNYYPNAAARSLQGKRTNTVALGLWPRNRNDQGTTEAF